MQVTIIPIVISAFGTVTKGLLKELEDLEVGGRVETIQSTALLRTARISITIFQKQQAELALPFIRTSRQNWHYLSQNQQAGLALPFSEPAGRIGITISQNHLAEFDDQSPLRKALFRSSCCIFLFSNSV